MKKMSTKGRYRRGPMADDAIATSQEVSGKHIHVLATSLRSAGLVRTKDQAQPAGSTSGVPQQNRASVIGC